MSNPLVAVVGRPNVGKSTIFNRLVGKRIAIVQDTPGVTRDRLYAPVEWKGRTFTVIDTGGINPPERDPPSGPGGRPAGGARGRGGRPPSGSGPGPWLDATPRP